MMVSQNTAVIVDSKKLTKRYKGETVVDQLTFQVEEGCFLGILGPNGAGKTTTLRMLVGHCPVDSGSMDVLGLPMPLKAAEIRSKIGIVPQMDNLDSDFTVRENLVVYGRYFNIKQALLDQKIKQLLAFASLEDKADSKITELSGGMRRRLTLARALINSPKLLILDEPTTGLDPQARQAIWQKLRELKQQGITLILTTHYMEEAERLCDRVMIMDHGVVMGDAAPKVLVKNEIESHVLEVYGASRELIERVQQQPGFSRYEKSGDIAFFYGEKLQTLMLVIEASDHDDYLYRPANLEDVFLKLTGRDLRE